VKLVKDMLVIPELSLLVDASLKPAWPNPSLGKNARLGKSSSFDYSV